MSRRPRLPAASVLDLLAEGQKQKEIAYAAGLTPTAIEEVLRTERRRQDVAVRLGGFDLLDAIECIG